MPTLADDNKLTFNYENDNNINQGLDNDNSLPKCAADSTTAGGDDDTNDSFNSSSSHSQLSVSNNKVSDGRRVIVK